MEKKQRIEWLDISRGICIILMVICHACSQAGNRWGLFNGYTGIFFLVFFFISSGITFNPSDGFASYAKRQIKKCIVPYTLISAVYLGNAIHAHSVSGNNISERIINAIASYVWGLSRGFTMGPVKTIGMGPKWFFMCYFVASCLFFLLKDLKKSGVIICILAIISTITQRFFVLPFALQSSVIGCMFIWIGYSNRERILKLTKNVAELNPRRILLYEVLAFVLSYCFVQIFYLISYNYLIQNGKLYFLDLGSNNYSFMSLIPTMTCVVSLVLFSVLMERMRFIHEFFSFCGKETFLILCAHDFDLCLLRNWRGRSVWFMFTTVLLYPAIIYIYRIVKKNIVNLLKK